MSTVIEEIAAVKAKISDLEHRIAVAEMEITAATMGGRSEGYIISLRSVLVATKNELVEMRKKENIILEQRKGYLFI